MTEHTEKDVLMKCTKCSCEEEVPSDSGNLKITNLDRLIFTKNGEFTI